MKKAHLAWAFFMADHKTYAACHAFATEIIAP